MTTPSSVFKKNIFFACLFIGFISFNPSAAQSIVGQWKQVSVKVYATSEAVQNSHGHLQAVTEMPKVDAIEDFHADNSFVETITSEGKKIQHNGNWSMTGNIITITVKGDKLVGIISNDNKTLVCTIETPKTEHMHTTKREWTYTKL